TFPWPGDLIVRVQHSFYEHMVLAQAWLVVPRTEFLAAVESVRNRIMGFASDAEQYVLDGADPMQSRDLRSNLSPVFHTHTYGTVLNVGQGNEMVVQPIVLQGDLDSLLSGLHGIGVPPEDAEKLKEAISADGVPRCGRLGGSVSDWVGKMVSKAASGAWSVG